MKEIIINVDEQHNKIVMLVENGKLIEKYHESNNIKRLEGNIYLGKVQNVLQGMQAAFIDIGEQKNTFIHLKDILPKLDSKTNNTEEVVDKSNIKDIIKPGNTILVQVKRDATNKKGARVSTHINLPGRFCVFMPNADFITISQKIEKPEERKRLLDIVKEQLPKGSGAIVRTAAIGKQKEEIIADLQYIQKQWENIKLAMKQNIQKTQVLYENSGIVRRILIDLADSDIHKIIVNNKKQYEEVKKILKFINREIQLELKEQKCILDMYDLNNQLDKALNRKIWLKCGGFITIDNTEALTAIDVNSGKYIGTKSLEQTVFTVNKEASIEIAKQLRLRDIGGIIIIDYIDMKDEQHKDKILEILTQNLKNDRSKTQIIGFTKLNLLEMTRKHMCSND